MEKEAFDNAFSTMPIEEDGDKVEYLGGILTVIFENGAAVEMKCDGSSDRFSFYKFDFSTPISQIEGRYEKFDKVSGYIFYSRYYDKDGKDVSISDAYILANLMVRDGDLLNMKDGQYIYYSISIR